MDEIKPAAGDGKIYMRTDKLHRLLAHSYSMYLFLFLVGVTLDMIFRFEIFATEITAPLGILLLLIGTVLVTWAQKTSRNLDKNNMTKETFCRGPYCYSRSPTHWGLFLLTLGFGIVANALFIILTTLISFMLAKFVFQEQEESILAAKYGTPYLEYKRSVRL